MADAERELEIQWIKFGDVRISCMLGKDILVSTDGIAVVFVETSRPEKKDVVYIANNEVRGDGIQCLCAHKLLPCFAIAEKARNPRVFVISYPNFEVSKSFESCTGTSYLALRFSEMEYLVALTGIPDYKIVVWNWKTSERIYMKETNIHNLQQSLYVSPISPIQILQIAETERKILFWNMNVCFKKTFFKTNSQELPPESKPPYCFCYGADGELYFLDSHACLYMFNFETHKSVIQYSPPEEAELTNYIPCLTWYKGGLVFSTPKNVQFWRRKSPEGWAVLWTYTLKLPLTKLLSSSLKDHLLGINNWNETLVFKGENQIECVTVRSRGSDFGLIAIIYPVGEYFMSYGNANKLFSLWTIADGVKTSQLAWTKERINDMKSNPKKPYLAVVTSDGSIGIINAYDPMYIMELDNVPLTRNSLNAIRFEQNGIYFCAANVDIGEFFLLKLPTKVDVVTYLKIDLKVVDYHLSESEDGKLRLMVVPMSQMCCRSGHNLICYIYMDKQKTFEQVKDIIMPWVVTSIQMPKFTSKELYCVLHRSRQIGVMNVATGKVVEKFTSGHQMKSISINCENEHLISYGTDGIVIITLLKTNKCLTVFGTQHRFDQGIKQALVDPYMKYALTLANNGCVHCVLLKKLADTSTKEENKAIMNSPPFKQLFLNPIVTEKIKAKAFEKLFHQNPDMARDGGGETKRKTKFIDRVWLELRQEEFVNLEEQRFRKEKLSVIEEFNGIKDKLRSLLIENYANVPERQLPVQAFDLDKVTRRKKIEDAKTEREKEKQYELALMKNLNKITDVIKRSCWESVSVKGREIHGILFPIIVQSYALLPEDSQTALKQESTASRLLIEKFFHNGDYFDPWLPRTDSALEMHINNTFQVSTMDITQIIKTKFKEEQLDDEKNKKDVEEEVRKLVWTGTSSHQFIQVDPNHCSQFEMVSFLQGHQEIRLIQNDIKKLMLWFNKEFKEIFTQKEQEMAFVYDRNNRFRHIISELSFFHFSPQICKTEIYDPEWAPQENPETIMTVADNEITAPKYISDSEMEIIKARKVEEERLRMLLMADDFKEKALVTMMDGVLEKLWEDEIKKDVTKPKCMIEKEPSLWTEDDLKLVKAYEEAVKTLQYERERYRKILEEKWMKTVAAVKDSVAKFDEKVVRLHFLKLRVESAIGQENLKCFRIIQRFFQRIEMDRKEDKIRAKLLSNEKKIESMTAELNKLVELLNECKNYFEALQNRDKNQDKNFKREFPDFSPMICEQLYKLSKKRPKLPQKASIYPTILNEMGRFAVTGNKPEHLPHEFIQYLKDIDVLDAQSNAPASVSQQSWELACKLRRAKIETELKIRACAIDLADAEVTVSNYHKSLKAAKDLQGQLQTDLQNLRTEKLNTTINSQIQLVMKKGLVEVPLTGHISDFSECILVTKETVVEVNKSIHKMGLQKIKAMEKAANFRKGIIYKEWEHKKLRMEIEDLKSHRDTVEKLQVLKELQAILVARARGFSEEKGFLYVENEIAKTKEKFHKVQTEVYQKIDDFELKIQKLNCKNKTLNEKLEELNVEVNELNMGRDQEFDEKNIEGNKRRMKKIRDRCKLVRKIQEQHNEILVLQTELELLRLKTYPTIKYRLP